MWGGSAEYCKCRHRVTSTLRLHSLSTAELVFLKGLVKLMEIGNFEDLLLFFFCLKLKIGTYTPNSCPTAWGAIVRSGNCLVVFHNPFFPFQPLFKLTKISLQFGFTPA